MAEKKNIPYVSEKANIFHKVRHTLDIYYPDNTTALKSVFIFIHGGTWVNGSKDIYHPLGRNMAENGIISVIINYRLGDLVDFSQMALDCASAVKWIYNNIYDYGGNKERITICGHSAGGHLAALIALDKEYFDKLNFESPVKGVILIDAFGLNIGHFIQEHGTLYLEYIKKIFTRDPKIWKKASPVSFVAEGKIPFMIFVGAQTYPFLLMDNEMFVKEIQQYNSNIYYETILGKTHIGMITQLENKNNPLYDKILEFIKEANLTF